jgi:hypothetical protein
LMANITASRAEAEAVRQHILRVHRSLQDTVQSRADEAFEPWGFRAPAPTLGCDPDEYRRDMLVKAKKLLPGTNRLRHVKIWDLPANALSQFEDLIYPQARAEAHRPDSVPPGELRKVHVPTANGHEIIEWVGQQSFVVGMGRPGRGVVAFRTPHGLEMTKS